MNTNAKGSCRQIRVGWPTKASYADTHATLHGAATVRAHLPLKLGSGQGVKEVPHIEPHLITEEGPSLREK